jgi:hypothetical protein
MPRPDKALTWGELEEALLMMGLMTLLLLV